MRNNSLINGYQNFTDGSNKYFSGNQLLNNSPAFMGSIRDQNFLQRMQMAKMEQMRRIKSIKDFGLSNEKLVKYIIPSVPEIKLNSSASIQLYNNLQTSYPVLNKREIPKILTEWYNTRTNLPYKNILKNENYNKTFRSIEDLIIHRVTVLDKDKKKLLLELEKLVNVLEVHDKELKTIFSTSEEAKHKQEFEFVNIYKYKNIYNPKDFSDLKKTYTDELKKIEKESKHIDELIETLMENEKISPEEVETLKKDYNYKPTKTINTFENLEEKLKKEIGDSKFNELLDEIEREEIEKSNDEKPKKKIKIKEEIKEEIKEPKKIIIKEEERKVKMTTSKEVDKMVEQYKNRKKK
jgi:hypothetical protein